MTAQIKKRRFAEGVVVASPSDLNVGGSGAGGGVTNLFNNPNAALAVDNSSVNAIGDFISSGGGLTVSRVTTGLPLEGVTGIDTGIRLTLGTGEDDQVTARFTNPAGSRNMRQAYQHVQLPSGYTSDDIRVELYSYSDAYVSDEVKIPISTDDSSGATLLKNYAGNFSFTYDVDDREYYEIRYINNNAGTPTGNITLNKVTFTPDSSAVVGSFNGIWKTYTEDDVTIREVGPTTLDDQQAYLQPYKDKSGSWRLRFNITGKFVGADTTQRFLIDGLTFKAGTLGTASLFKQPISVFVEAQASSNTESGYVEQNTGIIWIQGEKSEFTGGVSGDVALESKPTWADFDPTDNYYINDNLTNANVRLSYTKNNAQAHLNNLTTTVVYDDLEYDESNGQYNPATGIYTASVDHKVNVSARLSFAGGTGTSSAMTIRVNGTIVRRSDNGNVHAGIDTQVQLSAGDTLALNATNFINSETNSTSVTFNWLQISRIADYSAGSVSGFGHATATQSGLVKKNKIQEKTNGGTFTSDTSSVISFTGLRQGSTYKVTTGVDRAIRTANNGVAYVKPSYDGSDIRYGAGLSGIGTVTEIAETVSGVEATATFTVGAVSTLNIDVVATNGTVLGCYAILEELNNYEPTTEW